MTLEVLVVVTNLESHMKYTCGFLYCCQYSGALRLESLKL